MKRHLHGSDKHMSNVFFWAINLGFLIWIGILKGCLFVILGLYHSILDTSKWLSIFIFVIIAVVDIKFVYKYTSMYRFSDLVHFVVIVSPLIYLGVIGQRSTKGGTTT
jgi:hypothetical protein